MNRIKLAMGLVLICVGVFAAFMGVVASDTTDATFLAFVMGAVVGIVLVVGGLTLMIVGASEK